MSIKESRPENRLSVANITFWTAYLIGLVPFAWLAIAEGIRPSLLAVATAFCWSVAGFAGGYGVGHVGGYAEGFQDGTAARRADD